MSDIIDLHERLKAAEQKIDLLVQILIDAKIIKPEEEKENESKK